MITESVYIQFLSQGSVDIVPRTPYKKYWEDAGWDLFSSRHHIIDPMGQADIHTDIAIQMPKGLCGLLRPRSSTLARTGLLVLEGVIDQSYRGELYFMVKNLLNVSVTIEIGDRLAQILFLPVPQISFMKVTTLGATIRGDAGFGSTGGGV